MARSALITDITGQDGSYLEELPRNYARIHQPSSNIMSGKVQEMPQTGNTSFYPGSPTGCGRGPGREKYVRGEGKVFRYAGVGYLIADCFKTKQVFGGGQKVTFEGIVEMMKKAEMGRLEARVIG